jgi:hypothetical protein
MLAVRRPRVTEALHVLEGEGFIRSERKHITIRNCPALEEFAREAYGVPEEEYKQLFPTLVLRTQINPVLLSPPTSIHQPDAFKVS